MEKVNHYRKSYLRQQTPATSAGHIVWNVDIKADNYKAYLLMKSNASEKARVEVLVNGVSKGIREMKSTGVWESQKIDNLTVDLGSGSNTIAIRPIGNVGIAGIALVSVTSPLKRIKWTMEKEHGRLLRLKLQSR